MDFPPLYENGRLKAIQQRSNKMVRLSLFWRLVLGSLATVLVVAGVNIYALSQLRQLTALSSELVSRHYPAIESSRRLMGSISSQLRNEKKYFIVRDAVLLREFEQDAEDFQKRLSALLAVEGSEEGRRLLEQAGREQHDYQVAVHEQARAGAERGAAGAGYERRRDMRIGRITDLLDAYVSLCDLRVGTVMSESRDRTAQAEAVLQELLLVSILLTLVLAAVASYSILHPLGRVQQHIRLIGQGQFDSSMEAAVPRELRELVETVNWMGHRLKELDDLKAEFFSQISHELRAPLASLREGIQLLLDQVAGPVTAQQREALVIMQESSQRLIQQISTLLDLSKMEAGMMEYRIAPADLKRLADGSVNKVRWLAESKRVPVLIHAPDSRVWVPMDAARIEQVLDNLLSNALKFSPKGATVHVSIEPDPAAGGIRVAVKDAGPGIAPEDLPHIFNRFYQGRRQGTQTVAGSGVGLALAKKIVEAHQGRIWAESLEGQGTTIQFVLPMMERGAVA
jgi:two-component system, NtrC family, sensor histidine kinase GlrK